MKYLTILLLAALLISVMQIFSSPSKAEIAAINKPVILELFTSQSCSSCPPADKILSQLAKNPNVIALSCNVTYWNHLSWKDTLSHEFCTERQRQYSKIGGRRGRIFTPELIINGKESVIGSRGSKITTLIQQAAPIAPVIVSNDADMLNITLPEIALPATVTLVTYQADHSQYIPKGENHGRTVSYTNPVSMIEQIAQEWDGKAAQIAVPVKPSELVVGYAVLVHQGTASVGHVVAAGKVEMPKN